MAPNSIILPIIFLLLLSMSPSLESDNFMRFAKNHLKAFGYLSGDYKSTDDDYTSDEALVFALRKYQTFFGLNVSGRIDPDTLMMMSRPRCGVPDRPSTDYVHNITPKYAFYPGKPTWPKSMKKFQYTFLTVPPIPSRKASAAISSAFSTWSAASGFTFKLLRSVSKPAEIRIGFYTGDHGDGHPFDGRGGVVAHSFPPTVGILHFDADENWGTVEAADILDLESVALHEIGHILGLDHSDRPSAVMFPRHGYGLIKRHLDRDDIDGIHALYAD